MLQTSPAQLHPLFLLFMLNGFSVRTASTFGVSSIAAAMDKYVKVRKIGQGSFGCAYLATRKAGSGADSSEQHQKQQFVIKEILLDPRDQANAQREARLLAALDHPNIIACKESFLLKPSTPSAALLGHQQQRSTVLCIVTEFADGGDLSQELQRRANRRAFFEPDEFLGLFVQVCLALKHLHDRKILHRDIKPANIFLTKSGVVKVGDLGVATVLSHTLACAQTSIGTPYYTAPEICLGKRYNAKADIWSLGCVLFEMASFSHAFEGRSQRQLFDNIVRGVTPPLPACGSLSSIKRELQALVDDMLRKEPRGRPSVNQLIRRPLVLARIQTFLSARALATELNHTVLHGENVFRKKITLEDRGQPITLLDQHVRRAEPVARSPAMFAAFKPSSQPQQKLRKTPPPHVRNGKARVGSLLSASRKARGLSPSALKRNRPIPKRVQPARVPARISAVGNLNAAKQRVVSTNARRPGALTSAQVKAKLRAQIKANEAAAAAVAALPDPPSPPTYLKSKMGAKALGGVSERVAAFNSKWAAQKVAILPPPPPSKAIAKKIDVSTKPKQSARAYPKPVVVGVQRQTLQASKQHPDPVGIRPELAKKKKPLSAPKARGSVVRDSHPSLRERRLEWQAEAGGKPRTVNSSPLDDPIILVQQLPAELKAPPAPPTQEPAEQGIVLPPPPPTTLTSSLPEFADKNADVVGLASDSTHNNGDEDDQELTSLPSMANLEFERMVLQLKSVVELNTTSSDDEIDDEEEQQEEAFDPSVPPPPYSTMSTPSFSLENLSISKLEDPTFRLALQKRLQQHKLDAAALLVNEQVNVNGADQLVVDPAQLATLTWMQTYITSLL